MIRAGGDVAVAVHMDSFGWAAGAGPGSAGDPAWRAGLDRFLEIGDDLGLRYTFFVIARDLADPAVAARVRALADAGHEIASHSFSHPMDFGARPGADLVDEIRDAHRAIAEAAGRPPEGFAAPAWNASAALHAALSAEGYRYAATTFPSWLMVPMLLKLRWKYRGHPRAQEVLKRRDVSTWFFGRRAPHRLAQGLVELPVPTTPGLRLPCWHTLALILPEPVFDGILRQALQTSAFMYVVHPLDLVGAEDVPDAWRDAARIFERLGTSAPAKRRRLEGVLRRIAEGGGRFVTCAALAESAAGPVASAHANTVS